MRLCQWPRAFVGLPIAAVAVLLATGAASSFAQEPPGELPLEEIEESAPLTSADESQEDIPLDAPSSPTEQVEQTELQPRGEPSLLPVDEDAAEGIEAANSRPVEEEQTAPDEQRSLAKPAAPAELAEPTSIEPATFGGIQPGVSTREELETAWGPPVEMEQLDGQNARLRYAQEPFERVEAHVADGQVTSIIIFLAQRFPADELARQLQLSDLSPVVITDELGAWLGEAYPERGVVFHFPPEAAGRQVSQVILEPVDAYAFLLRAESYLEADMPAVLQDLDLALQLDPEFAPAHRLRAELLFDLGRLAEALASAEAAVEIDQANAQYRLTLADILTRSGDFAAASAQTRRALSLAGEQKEWEALALLQLGNQIAGGPDRDYKRATEYHMRAIQSAKPLADHPQQAVRRVAAEVLVDAHLAVAQDIAWGHWRQKEQAVPKWLARADEIARQCIDDGDAPGDLGLRVARQALAAHVGLGGSLDPAPWMKRLQEVGGQQLDGVTDELRQNRLRWEVGVALYDAMQTCHLRAEHDKALEYGAAAVSYLEAGAVGRDTTATDAYLLGRLYFRVGSIYAIQHADHPRAITWFDKAAPLLKQPAPKSALSDTGRQGESLVSMAVSYWQQSQRDQALELTDHGVQLMEQAVEEGMLESSALSVPYGNLATMHQQLGNLQRARQYIELVGATEPIEP